MAELDGIVNQVVQDLLDLAKVCVNHLDAVRERQVKADVLGITCAFKGSSRILDDPVDIKIRPGQVSLGVQGVEGEHAFRQLVEPLCFGNDPGQILFVHILRYGAVQDGFQIAFDGGQGRPEIMGYIGNEVFLILLHLIQFVRHIVQRIGQITHLVMGFYINPIFQVACRVFVGANGDFAQGQVNGLGKYQKDDQREGKHNGGRDIKYVQDIILGLGNLAQWKMDQNITVGIVIPGNGCGNAEDIFIKQSVKPACGIGTVPHGRRVEIADVCLDP